MDALEKEFAHYQKNKAEYLAKYKGKVIVLKGEAVIGEYDDRLIAVQETVRKGHDLGTFLVQAVTEHDDQVRFRSRVG